MVSGDYHLHPVSAGSAVGWYVASYFGLKYSNCIFLWHYVWNMLLENKKMQNLSCDVPNVV